MLENFRANVLNASNEVNTALANLSESVMTTKKTASEMSNYWPLCASVCYFPKRNRFFKTFLLLGLRERD